jgi:hypothetical protein
MPAALPSPGMRVITGALIALSLAVPASAGARCAHYSNPYRMGTRVGHLKLFTTTVSTVWCYDGHRVTRLGSVRVYPSLTDLGSLLGWEFRGAVARDQRVFAVPGDRRGAYRVRRVVHWQQCLKRCFHLYVELNSFLYGSGWTSRRNRVRNG